VRVAEAASARVLAHLARLVDGAAEAADAELLDQRARPADSDDESDAGDDADDADGVSPALARALKLLQALGQAAQRVGVAMGERAGLVAPALLRCVRAERPPLLQASALVTLADVATSARRGFHPWAAELTEACAAALAHARAHADVRRAAAHTLAALALALGDGLLATAGAPAVKRAYRALVEARECSGGDVLLARHAAGALGELEAVCTGFLFR
jgi:hypothetical protein